MNNGGGTIVGSVSQRRPVASHRPSPQTVKRRRNCPATAWNARSPDASLPFVPLLTSSSPPYRWDRAVPACRTEPREPAPVEAVHRGGCGRGGGLSLALFLECRAGRKNGLRSSREAKRIFLRSPRGPIRGERRDNKAPNAEDRGIRARGFQEVSTVEGVAWRGPPHNNRASAFRRRRRQSAAFAEKLFVDSTGRTPRSAGTRLPRAHCGFMSFHLPAAQGIPPLFTTL